MKAKLLVFSMVTIGALNTYAGTFQLNAKCTAAVKSLTKLVVSQTLSAYNSKAKIVSIKVNRTLPQMDDMAISKVKTEVITEENGETGSGTMTTNVMVTSDNCILMSFESEK